MREELLALLSAVASGDEDAFSALSEQYAPLIRSMGAKYLPSFHMAGDVALSEQDLEQEARLALYRAALTYDRTQSRVSFGLYAKICIRNSLVSSLRRVRSERNTDSKSPRKVQRTARQTLLPEDTPDLARRIRDVLSPYECAVLEEYIRGRSVKSISLTLGRPEKSVSNAVYRIRTKIRGLLNPKRY